MTSRALTSGSENRRPVKTSIATAGPAVGRIDAIDLARGVAVTLMILSHGVKGLLDFDQIPVWGMVPIHLVTKFSSSLFILVFGVALAVAFVPHTTGSDWPLRRRKLLIRALVVFFWYKVLTIVEMVHLYEPDAILNALLYRGFPVYVEILGFYAIALMWIPFALPLWRKTPTVLQFASPLLAVIAYAWLYRNFDFFGSDVLQALVVEHEDHYTWGQLSRLPLVLLGLVAGDFIARNYRRPGGRMRVTLLFGGIGVLLLGVFTAVSWSEIGERLWSIAMNEGKHPPEAPFMLFSVGGASLILAAALLGGRKLAVWLAPITVIGKNALQGFIFHIFLIFIVFRYLLDYWHSISYGYALALTGIAIIGTAIWIKATRWVQANS